MCLTAAPYLILCTESLLSSILSQFITVPKKQLCTMGVVDGDTAKATWSLSAGLVVVFTVLV